MLRPFEPLAARVWPTEAHPPLGLAEAQQKTAIGRMSSAAVWAIHTRPYTLVDGGSKPELAAIEMLAVLPLELTAASFLLALAVVQRIPATFAARAAEPRDGESVRLPSLLEPLRCSVEVQCKPSTVAIYDPLVMLETREYHRQIDTLAADSELQESWKLRTVVRSAEHSEALAAIERTSREVNRADFADSAVHLGLTSLVAVL